MLCVMRWTRALRKCGGRVHLLRKQNKTYITTDGLARLSRSQKRKSSHHHEGPSEVLES